MFSEDDLVRAHKGRSDLLGLIIFICFLVILIRLWYLQIYQGDLFFEFSRNNRFRKEIIKAPRGLIYSRNNQLLIDNTPRFDAIIIPQYLRNKEETLTKLSKVLSLSKKEIEASLRKERTQAKYRPITIKKNISPEEVAIIETESVKLPGVRVNTFISRDYKDREIGSHVLGYVTEISQRLLDSYRKRDQYNYKLGDFIGRKGIEEKFDLELRGRDGYEFVEVDALGRMRRQLKENVIFSNADNQEAIPGNNIRLTIDRDLQKVAYDSLEGKIGSAVAIDVNTGEVLAMVSRPSFDPSEFSKGLSSNYWSELIKDPGKPFLNRTIQEHYPPGSTFKTFTAIAALEENIISPEKKIFCKPTFRLGRRVYSDWIRSGHGWTDVYKSLKRSVDVYYYHIAKDLDIDILANYARMFGLGSKTGISLSRETSGLIPTKEWKRKRFGQEWQLGETVSCVIGQSYVSVTPLQLAVAYGAIANGGKVYKPYLIKEIFTPQGEVIQRSEPTLLQTANVSEKTLEAVKQGLYQVVNEPRGTGWWSRGKGIQMAGKSGTSQVRSMSKKELFNKCKDMPYEDRHHGVFVAFAPYDDPKIAIASVVEHGCGGSGSAAPIIRDIAQVYMKKYHPKKYEENIEKDKVATQKYLRYVRSLQEKKEKAEEQEDQEEEVSGEDE